MAKFKPRPKKTCKPRKKHDTTFEFVGLVMRIDLDLRFENVVYRRKWTLERPHWALCRRSVQILLMAASNRRKSNYRVKPLKWVKHLRFGNGCFRNSVRTRPAASPQGSSEPKADLDPKRSIIH